MTRQDRKKFSILVVLLAVLGLTLVLGYRMSGPAAAGDVQLPENKTAASLPASSDGARIRLDLVEKPEGSEGEAGRKNVFQYRQAPPPPPSPVARTTDPGTLTPQIGPIPAQPVAPPPPPPPPPIPLRYEGFAIVNSPAGGLTAFLSDQSRHYNVTVGEVLMGRFRITRISDTSVEVEDLEYNRRQILPLVK